MKKQKKIKSAKKNHEPQSEATHQQILEVATRLFAEKGFDGVTTKEICDEASANISSLHYHFETKHKLFLTIIEQLGESFLQKAKNILTPPQTKDEMRVRLELILNEALGFYNNNPYLNRIIHHEMILATDRSQETFKYFYPIIEIVKIFFLEASKKEILDKKIDYNFIAFSFMKLLQPDSDNHNLKQLFFNIDVSTAQGRQLFNKNKVQLFLEGIIQR